MEGMSEQARRPSPDHRNAQDAATLPEPAAAATLTGGGAAPAGQDTLTAAPQDTVSPSRPAAARSSPSAPALGIPKSLLRWERYELQELLGAGGMGAVYKARDPRLGRLVALKLIHPGLGHGASASGEVIVRRFHREARLQAALDHPHVCKVYEIGELPGAADEQGPGHPYIAMQLISGQPLQRAQREMSLLEKVRIMQQVAEALHAAHRQGLIHRDIKPSNIDVSSAGR